MYNIHKKAELKCDSVASICLPATRSCAGSQSEEIVKYDPRLSVEKFISVFLQLYFLISTVSCTDHPLGEIISAVARN